MTTHIEMTSQIQTKPSSLRKLLWASPLAILLASVANVGLYTVAGLFFPEVTAWPGAGVSQIIGANIVYLLFGTALFAVLTRFSARPARNFMVAATIGLVLSFWLPISAGFGGPTPAGPLTVVVLSLMHVVSYAIVVPLFIRRVLN